MSSSTTNQKSTLDFILKALYYFPVRFSICAFISSIILIKNDAILVTAEKQILVGMLHFFRFPSYFLGGQLYVGHFNAPTQIIVPIDTQLMFTVFFITLAIVTRASLETRIRILFYGGLCALALILNEFLIIVFFTTLGFTSSDPYVQAGIIGTGIVGALCIETMLFNVITLPKATKTQILVKRDYTDEYIFLAVLLFAAGVVIYLTFNVMGIKADSPGATYVALNISNILALKYYIAYFFYEAKLPQWIRWIRHPSMHKKMNLSATFLLPAYNEEKGIGNCIRSIDVAASYYPGKTEIVVINDGSKDNTAKVVEEEISKLKHSTGKLYNIPNSGKGYALQYGLERVSGDVIFRVDTDSVVDKHAIEPVMKHFLDPTVGSVSGMIFPVDERSLWQKAMVMLGCLFVFYRRGQELIDSILVQPGAFSIFRREALVKAGGWARHQFGEDGELTLRLGRFGYRNEFEQHAIVLSDAPDSLKELREQRIRWGIAYYHSRGRNTEILKEYSGPRKVIFLLNLLSHGGGFMLSMFWPFLAAAIVAGTSSYSITDLAMLLGIPLSLVIVELLIFGMQYILYIYFLKKFNKFYLVKYLPLMRIYDLILSLAIKPEAMEILLAWSSKYKELNDKTFKILGRMAKNA
ncbi:MAG TPA: glycosyltransferase [Candidatus Bathyarchaeia archaeon]|nr:glycosyltransferase [Candidatus Bathyarchaeia archaeon]